MSDDTPTRKFENPDANAPTERFDQVDGAGAAGHGNGGNAGGADAPAPPTDGDRSKRLIVILSVIGGILLVAVIVLLVSLLARGEGPLPTPTASPTPSASGSPTPSATPTQSASPSASPSPTPSPTSTPTAPPQPTEGISSFEVDDDRVDCGGETSVPVRFEWEANGVQLWFGVQTTNAKDAPYGSFPLVYSLDFDYQCGQPSGSQIYTITVQESNGDLESETIEIRED